MKTRASLLARLLVAAVLIVTAVLAPSAMAARHAADPDCLVAEHHGSHAMPSHGNGHGQAHAVPGEPSGDAVPDCCVAQCVWLALTLPEADLFAPRTILMVVANDRAPVAHIEPADPPPRYAVPRQA